MTEAEIDHLHERYSRLAAHAKELGLDLDWEKDEDGRPAGVPTGQVGGGNASAQGQDQSAVKPPSMMIISPLTKSEAGEAR